MPVLTRLVVLWLLGACASAADLNLVRGQECIVPGAEGPLPLSPEECARYDERPQNFAIAPVAGAVIQCEGEGDLEGNETCKTIVECSEDPEHPLCRPPLHGYGVDYGPTPSPDGPDVGSARENYGVAEEEGLPSSPPFLPGHYAVPLVRTDIGKAEEPIRRPLLDSGATRLLVAPRDALGGMSWVGK